jgi:molybdate transport system regulatory protein
MGSLLEKSRNWVDHGGHKAVSISKEAWRRSGAQQSSDAPVVERSVGGSGGGGGRITAHGEKVLALLRDMDSEFQGFLAAMGEGRSRFDRFYRYFQMTRRWSMKTSARNQFLGRVVTVTRGAVNSEVILDIGGGDKLAAIVTNTSVDNLELAPGTEAFALIKAPWVIVTTDETLKPARNRLTAWLHAASRVR